MASEAIPKLPDYMVKEPEREPLQPRIIPGLQANYEPATYDATIHHGLTPHGPNLLVLMDVCLDVSEGGVMLLPEIVERMNEACITGCIYKIGPDAYRGQIDRPKVGERVYIEKYAGIKAVGRDGRMYRVIDEKCIACTIEDDHCASEI